MIQNTQLKEYLRCLFKLESELYKYQQLYKTYESSRNSYPPEKPEKQSFTKPAKPTLLADTHRTIISSRSYENAAFVFYAISAIILLTGLLGAIYNRVAVLALSLTLAIPFVALGVFFVKKEKILTDKEIQLIDTQRKLAYQTALDKYQRSVADEEQRYEAAMREYNVKREAYHEETKRNLQDVRKIILLIQDALNRAYAKDIIYKRYQNLIAISSFLEYIENERCTMLEGSGEAYDTFENEIEVNKIVQQLPNAMNSLQQLKNNQFILYNMLDSSKKEISNLLFRLNKGQSLAEYYNKASDVAASISRTADAILA